MIKKSNRAISAMLCLVLALSVFQLVAGAAFDEANKIPVSSRRFCSNEITVENAVPEKNSNGSVSFTFDDSNPKMSMAFVPLNAKTKANALRIVLKNESTVSGMRLDYIYQDDNGISKSGFVCEDIHKSSEDTEYIIPVSNADSLTSLVVSFNGGETSSGKITVVSIGAISYCVDGREYVGALSSVALDESARTAAFSGSVSYDTILSHPNGRVVLYKLSSGERIEDVDHSHPSVASYPITLNFKFEFEVKNELDLCSRYFAAVLTEKNDILPITPETCLTNEANAGSTGEENNTGFKGIETNFYAGAVENGTTTAFVDIYVDKLENEHGDGYQYILAGGQEYYFDRNYISEIDSAINSYAVAGVSVYLRFLVGSNDPSFTNADFGENYKNVEYFAIDPRSDEVTNNLYACADFIVSRYADNENSALKGIVLGRSLDSPLRYNFCETMPMSDYADMLARTYCILKRVLEKRNNGLEIILPVSNNLLKTDGLVTLDIRDSKYPSNLLIDCILQTIIRYGFDVSSTYFMLESMETPIFDQHFTSNPDIGSFVESIGELSDKYKGLPSEIFFCWFPDSASNHSDMISNYVYNYNFLACADGVRGYIVSMLNFAAESLTAEENAFKAIKNTYKYIDTQNNIEVGKNVLAILGAESWENIFGRYFENNVIKRTHREESLLYSMPSGVSGSYNMWDFSKMSGTAGWSASDGCSSLMVYTPYKNFPRGLSAGFKGDTWGELGAEYGSIIYHSSDLITDGISGFSFDLVIPSGTDNEQKIFELKITFGADKEVLETSGIIKNNVRTTVYADVSSVDRVEYVKISIRALDGDTTSDAELLVNSISIHSDKYNDGELENIVLSGKITGGGADNVIAAEEDVMLFVLVSIGIVLVLAAWGFFILSQRKNEG